MTARRPDVGRVTKRLVAVVDGTPGDALAEHPQEAFDLPGFWGLPPEDGDAVGIPTPCARLRAGYWCSCGGHFVSLRGHVPMSRARVELMGPNGQELGDAIPYIDGPPSKTLVPPVDPEESAELARLLEALPAGTVVERNGLGFAPEYRPSPLRAGAWRY